MKSAPRLVAVFYTSASGNEPVREWLKNMIKQDRRSIGEDIAYVQYKWPIWQTTRGSFARRNLGNQNIAR